MADERKDECNPNAGLKSEDGDTSEACTPDASRRRLIKAGLVAGPVILTLKGSKALAQQTTSSNLSHPSQP